MCVYSYVGKGRTGLREKCSFPELPISLYPRQNPPHYQALAFLPAEQEIDPYLPFYHMKQMADQHWTTDCVTLGGSLLWSKIFYVKGKGWARKPRLMGVRILSKLPVKPISHIGIVISTKPLQFDKWLWSHAYCGLPGHWAGGQGKRRDNGTMSSAEGEVEEFFHNWPYWF